MRRRRRGWSRRRVRSFGIGLTLAVVTFEVVYRLVALPPDYVPPERAAQYEAAMPATADRAPGRFDQRMVDHALRPEDTRSADVALPEGLRLAGRIERPASRVALALGPAPATGPNGHQAGHAPAPPAALSGELPAPVEPSAGPVLAALPSLRPPPLRGRQGGPALVSIVIDDMGYSPASLERLQRMPGPLTLAFLPNAEGTPAMLERARSLAGGFELMLHLPMEPLGDADPGEGALLVDLDEGEIRQRLRRALEVVPGVVGVNNHMGSRFTADPRGLAIVMDELRRQPLFFLDSLTNPSSLAESQAAAAGIPATRRDVFIDHVPEAAAIGRQLRLIEQLARRQGSVIAIGHPYPETLAALERWLPTLERNGFRLARVGEVIALRHCGDATLPPTACNPALQLVGNQPAPLRPRGAAVAP